MRLALLGYGRMGRAIEALASSMGATVVAVLDDAVGATRGSLADAEVAIDFTTPEAVLANVERVSALGLDVVVGTTGWYDRIEEARRLVDDAGTGLVWAPNFSMGVQMFYRLVREAGRLVDGLDDYDVYVDEVHHRHKLDHPSGTGRRLAELLIEAIGRKRRWSSVLPEGAIDPAVLHVGVTRAGEVPGTHRVGIEGTDDSIELTHRARGRDGFARGALEAAVWIRARKGFYGIDAMLDDRLGQA